MSYYVRACEDVNLSAGVCSAEVWVEASALLPWSLSVTEGETIVAAGLGLLAVAVVFRVLIHFLLKR